MGRVGKGILAGVGTMVFCTVSLIVIGATVGESAGIDRETRNSVPYILGKLAEAGNEMKGQEVEPGVYVDAATIKDRELTYSYNIPAVRNGQYNPAAKRKAERMIQEEVCDDRKMRKAIEGGATINYTYLDANGTRLFTIMVTKLTCRYVG